MPRFVYCFVFILSLTLSLVWTARPAARLLTGDGVSSGSLSAAEDNAGDNAKSDAEDNAKSDAESNAEAAFDPLDPAPILSPLPEKYRDAKRSWQGIPSLAASSDDRVWVTWYSGGKTEDAENIVLLATSGDGGETWSEPLFAIDPPGIVRAFDPALWTDPDGNVRLYWAQGEMDYDAPASIWDGRDGVWEIMTANPADGEKAVWGGQRRIADGVMIGKPIVDSKNRRLFPVAIWAYPGKYSVDPRHCGATLFVSTDGEKTVDFLGVAKIDPAVALYAEHNIIEKKDGSFWILARTQYGIGESISTDEGRTWTDLAPSVLRHTSSRFFVRRLASGNLILVKNGPTDQDVGRTQMTAFLSEDDGKTWIGGLVLDERKSVSYPDGDQTPDGTIYVCYDYDRYGAAEVYCARFTEDDVRAGKIVSERGRLKNLVNKATGEKPK